MTEHPQRFGRFVVCAEAGSGGMGDVFRGRDPLLDRDVALKVMQAKRRLSPLAKARFMREARTLSQLDHPNICRIYDFIEDTRQDVLVLEYLDGTTLKAATRCRMIGKDDCLKLLIQIASALEVAHKAQIIHRDLKPDNLMVLRDRSVKVLDFGLARSSEDHEIETSSNAYVHEYSASDTKTTEGSLVGTLAYMSPEQARGDKLTTATDIYSLGIVMIEVLTGRRAYPEDLTQPAMLGHVAFRKIIPFDQEIGDVELVRFLERMTQPDTTLRPSATDVKLEAQRLLSRPARARRRRKMAFAATAALALIALFTVQAIRVRQPTWKMDDPQVRTVLLREAHEQAGWMALLMEALGQYKLLDVQLAHSELSPTKTEFLVTTQFETDPNQATLVFTIEDGSGHSLSETVSASEMTPALFGAARRIAFQLGAGGSVTSEESHSSDPLLNEIYAHGVQMMENQGEPAAISFFEVCVQLDPNFFRAQLRLAQCLTATGKFDEAMAIARRVTEQPDLSLRQRGFLRMGLVQLEIGELNQALHFFEQAESDAVTASDQRQVAEAQLRQSSVYRRQGVLDLARNTAESAARTMTKLGDMRGLATAESRLAAVYRQMGDIREAMSRYDHARQLQQSCGDWQGVIRTESSMGSLSRLFGDLKTAELHYQRAWNLAVEQQDIERQASLANNLGGLAVRRYDYENAVQHYQKAVALHQVSNRPSDESLARHNLGWTYLQLHQWDRAETELGLALEGFARGGDSSREGYGLLSLKE